MINNDGYIRYNYINKSLLGTIKIAQFQSKRRLQRAKLAATLKINNIDITDELKKAVFKNNFTIEFMEQLETRLVEDFVVIENLLTF